jgi:membrane protein involved in colicin uptake
LINELADWTLRAAIIASSSPEGTPSARLAALKAAISAHALSHVRFANGVTPLLMEASMLCDRLAEQDAAALASGARLAHASNQERDYKRDELNQDVEPVEEAPHRFHLLDQEALAVIRREAGEARSAEQRAEQLRRYREAAAAAQAAVKRQAAAAQAARVAAKLVLECREEEERSAEEAAEAARLASKSSEKLAGGKAAGPLPGILKWKSSETKANAQGHAQHDAQGHAQHDAQEHAQHDAQHARASAPEAHRKAHAARCPADAPMSRLDSIEASPKLAIQLWLSKVLAKNHLLLIAT